MRVPRQVPELEARLAAGGEEGPAVEAEIDRAEVVGQLNLGHKVDVGCPQGGRGLGAKLGQVAAGRGHDGQSCEVTPGPVRASRADARPAALSSR